MRKNSRKTIVYFTALFIVLVAYITYCSIGKVAPVSAEPDSALMDPRLTASSISWPKEGQSAVAVLGTRILDTHGTQTPSPTASTAKLITALTVLKDKPLAPGEQGPEITITQNDVNIYNAYVAEDGSVAAVKAGEQISEYQMLECMLLPSANNMADSLAIWAYGSLPAYSAAANAYIKQLGLEQTHVGPDASGFNPATVSTAHDLVRLGELAMENPVLSQIVSQKTASGIPVVGNIKNVNFLLGNSNIIGVKTGNTNQAGGVFVGAASTVVNGKDEIVVTANVGAPTLFQAVSGSLPFIRSAETNFVPVTLIHKGSQVAQYRLPWDNSPINAVAANSLISYVWGGSYAATGPINMKAIAVNNGTGKQVGSIDGIGEGLISSQAAQIRLSSTVPKPSLSWKLIHPEKLRV